MPSNWKCSLSTNWPLPIRYRPVRFASAQKGIRRSARDSSELKPPGSWNELEVELRGQSLHVWINGRQVQNVDLARARFRPAQAVGRSGQGCAGIEARP